MLLAIWDDGVWQDALTVAMIVVVAYFLVLWIGALVWTYRDIQTRTRDPYAQLIAVLVVLLFNLPGVPLYMVLRPKETLAEAYDRRLGSEALLQEIQEQETCPTCRRKVADDFIACPYCRTTLRTPCESCGRALSTNWVLCPYCGADRRALVPIAPPSRPSVEPAAIAADAAQRRNPARTRRPSTATYTPPAPKPVAPVDSPVDAAGT